jgi:hypothetical protein
MAVGLKVTVDDLTPSGQTTILTTEGITTACQGLSVIMTAILVGTITAAIIPPVLDILEQLQNPISIMAQWSTL